MADKLEMRELNGGDIFTMLAIIGKLNIKDQVVELIERQFSNAPDLPGLDSFKKRNLLKLKKKLKKLKLKNVV